MLSSTTLGGVSLAGIGWPTSSVEIVTFLREHASIARCTAEFCLRRGAGAARRKTLAVSAIRITGSVRKQAGLWRRPRARLRAVRLQEPKGASNELGVNGNLMVATMKAFVSHVAADVTKLELIGTKAGYA